MHPQISGALNMCLDSFHPFLSQPSPPPTPVLALVACVHISQFSQSDRPLSLARALLSWSDPKEAPDRGSQTGEIPGPDLVPQSN